MLSELQTKLSILRRGFLWGRKLLHKKSANTKQLWYRFVFAVDLLLILGILGTGAKVLTPMISPLANDTSLHPLTQGKRTTEVFGFAPYFTFNKLDNVDFSTLTTFAYFGVPVLQDGTLDTTDVGYKTFRSKEATQIFQKAHKAGTRVVLTVTQFDNATIRAFLDDPNAQQTAIDQITSEVEKRGIDGINIDFEYMGNPGQGYRQEFTTFVTNLTDKMHSINPNSKVTVSVYASAVKDPKVYDLASLSPHVDGIFMMAYDFAVASSDNAMPTAPLYGYKNGKYWYDVSTAVDDFLKYMPANKLILGVPWYGYNYAVNAPQVKTAVTHGYYTYYKKGRYTYSNYVPVESHAQTYALAADNITPTRADLTDYKEGWDNEGQVGFKAYKTTSSNTWRMVFIEDTKSLGIKYDFAKEKKLAGVGIWALGFDEGKTEMWQLLREKFGQKLADASIIERKIDENY